MHVNEALTPAKADVALETTDQICSKKNKGLIPRQIFHILWLNSNTLPTVGMLEVMFNGETMLKLRCC